MESDDEHDSRLLAGLIAGVRERPQDESAIRSVTEKVKALTLRKPVYA